MMNTDIFRLAAVLCADSNYEIKPKTIHRKIIESIFIDNKNGMITVYKLIDKIKSKYDLIFEEEEIYEIVTKDISFNISPHKDEFLQINLVHSRYLSLKNKIQKSDTDDFISKFYTAITELQKIRNERKSRNEVLIRNKKIVKQQLIDNKVKNDFIKYQLGGYIYILLAILCGAFVVLIFFYQERDWNYVSYFKSLFKSSTGKEIMKYIFLLPSAFFVFCTAQIYKRLIGVEAKEEKKKIFRQKYNDRFICRFYSKL